MFILLSLSFLFNSLFIFSSHPLTSTIMILLQTLLFCILMGYQFINFWFSYILFLIFLGGMMVLFIYMTSLASNELLQMTITFSFKNLIIFLLIMMSTLLFPLSLLLTDTAMPNTQSIIFCTSQLKLLNFPTFLITILLMSYLYIALIAITKISSFNHGPLRQNTH